jgi:predicted lipid-binding transport protein (Tim44 family)
MCSQEGRFLGGCIVGGLVGRLVGGLDFGGLVGGGFGVAGLVGGFLFALLLFRIVASFLDRFRDRRRW